MDSSKITRRIGLMAFSVIAAVASIRITYLIDAEASTYYVSALVDTFTSITSTMNIVSILVIAIVIAGLIVRLRVEPLDVFPVGMSLAVAFMLGIWITTVSYNTIQYDTTSWWMILIIGINLLITYVMISLPLGLIGLFLTQVLRS